MSDFCPNLFDFEVRTFFGKYLQMGKQNKEVHKVRKEFKLVYFFGKKYVTLLPDPQGQDH